MALKDYEIKDFKVSLQSSLPAGEYWQGEQSATRDKLIEAIAQDLKITHDETKLLFLYQSSNVAQGWKLSDYQSLLESYGHSGNVTDTPLKPNIIQVEINDQSNAGETMQAFEVYRLPHTAFEWSRTLTGEFSATLTKRNYETARQTNSFKLDRQTSMVKVATTTQNHHNICRYGANTKIETLNATISTNQPVPVSKPIIMQRLLGVS